MAEKHQISNLKKYLLSNECRWFWFSLAFIFAFFIFSGVTSENILILFIKRATTLLFAFLLPGYLITKIFYPKKNEVNIVEKFTFSVAFSLTFIMLIGYILNRFHLITRFYLAIAAFVFAIFLAFLALKRSYNHIKYQTEKRHETVITKSTIIPLIIIAIFAFILNSYDPITSPIIAGVDTFNWIKAIQSILGDKYISLTKIIFQTGYPAGFPIIVIFLQLFSGTSTYDILRYIPIFSFLNVFPIFILTFYIFRSKYVSFLAMILAMSSRWVYTKGSAAVPQMMIHFFLILFLFMLLKTLEKPSLRNSLVTTLLLSSSVLLYHYELSFLIVFAPLIFLLVWGHLHFIKKSYGQSNNILKSGLLILIISASISGFLWYFLSLDNIENRWFNGETQGRKNPETFMYVIYDGWTAIIFSAAGLLFIFLRPRQLRDFRYQFLLIYFFVMLLIIEKIPNLINMGSSSVRYIFTYLTFPLSMLAGYGIFNLFSPFFKKSDSKIRGSAFAMLLLTVFILNVSFINYSYPSPLAKMHILDKRIDEGNYRSIFFQNYVQIKYITPDEYNAFTWINENTRRRSNVVMWDGKFPFQRILNKRSNLWISKLNISDSTSTGITKSTYPWASKGRDIYVFTGLAHDQYALRRAKAPDFSNETLKSIAQDPNYNLVYQNPQIKIYRIEHKNFTVLLDKPGGFEEIFEDTVYWGLDLNEKTALKTDGDIATYKARKEGQPIDVDFSTGLNTRVYPYFETRMKVDSGKISISVYDSTGKEHTFLKNYTTNGQWETYKFNLYDWLTGNEHDTLIYGIKITNTLGNDSSFSSSFDWISIHNHIFFDMFKEESGVSHADNVSITNGYVTLSKKIEETLSNSGFENDFEGWHPGAKWSIDVEEYHSGNKSAVLKGTVDPAKDASAYLDTKIRRGVLKPKTQYQFSIWIKGNVTDAIRGSVRQLGSANLRSRPIYFSKNNRAYDNWTYHEEIITTPDDVNGDFHIRIYGGGGPAVWIDELSIGEEVYESSGKFISTTTNTKNPIVSVTPTWSSVEPNSNVNITVEISVDNGTTWTGAENGATINYATNDANKNMLYRAFFQTNDNRRSPILHDIAITYEEKSPEQ